MPAELVIRGGTVYDGTGASGRSADVAISDRMITEIGAHLEGDRVLDASGCAVTPGFIDIHTHYDAQVFWDPALRPSSYHGVTTVVAGNCGFYDRADSHGAARRDRRHTRKRRGHGSRHPERGHRRGNSRRSPSTWQLVGQRGTALNFTAYIGHSRCGSTSWATRPTSAPPRPRRSSTWAGWCSRRSTRARPGSRPASPTRIVASTASRSRADSPTARRGRRALRRGRPGGQGRHPHHAGQAVHLRRRLRMAAADRPTVHLPAVRGTGREASGAGRAARARARGRRQRLAPGHAAAAHHAVHAGGPVQPQRRDGLRRVAAGRPRGAHRRVPRSGVEGARRSRT